MSDHPRDCPIVGSAHCPVTAALRSLLEETEEVKNTLRARVAALEGERDAWMEDAGILARMVAKHDMCFHKGRPENTLARAVIARSDAALAALEAPDA